MSGVQRAVSVLAAVTTPIPDDVPVAIDYSGDRVFRAARIREQLDDGVYTVTVDGPIITKVGRDHSTHTGLVIKYDLQDLPGVLHQFCIGPEGLLGILAAAGAGEALL